MGFLPQTWRQSRRNSGYSFGAISQLLRRYTPPPQRIVAATNYVKQIVAAAVVPASFLPVDDLKFG